MDYNYMPGLLDRIQETGLIKIPPESYMPAALDGKVLWSSGYKEGGMSTLHPVSYQGKPAILKVPAYLKDERLFEDRIMNNFRRENNAYSALYGADHIAELLLSRFVYYPTHSINNIPFFIINRYPCTLDDAIPYLHLKQAISYSYTLALAIRELHNRDLVHRDIRPTNCLINKDGLFLSDFGIADKHDEICKHDMVGKEPYAAPEQYNCWILKKSDVWAWGVTHLNLLLKKKVETMDEDKIVLPCTTCFYPEIHSKDEISVTEKFGGKEEFKDRIRFKYGKTKETEDILEASIELLQKVIRPINSRITIDQVLGEVKQMAIFLGIDACA